MAITKKQREYLFIYYAYLYFDMVQTLGIGYSKEKCRKYIGNKLLVIRKSLKEGVDIGTIIKQVINVELRFIDIVYRDIKQPSFPLQLLAKEKIKKPMFYNKNNKKYYEII